MTAEDLRLQGRADAVVIVFVHLSRRIPTIELSDVARMANVPAGELSRAVQRMRERHSAGARPSKTTPTRSTLPPIFCTICGAEVPRVNRQGHPRTRCRPRCDPVRLARVQRRDRTLVG